MLNIIGLFFLLAMLASPEVIEKISSNIFYIIIKSTSPTSSLPTK